MLLAFIVLTGSLTSGSYTEDRHGLFHDHKTIFMTGSQKEERHTAFLRGKTSAEL